MSDCIRHSRVVALMLIGGAMGIAGCSDLAGTGREPIEPFALPDDQSVPRVVVLGDLVDFLPTYSERSSIDRFLYGPSDYRPSLVRNPQGLGLLGTNLLVCDQGQPDVIVIDLATGKSGAWCDSDHRPRCPVDIAVADDMRVFVADSTSRIVLVFDASGRFIEELTPDTSSDRQFRPCAVCVHGGVLYVGNAGDRRIERYDLGAATWLEPLSPPSSQATLFAPTGLDVNGAGELIIADAVRGLLYRVTATGEWLEPISRSGRGPGEMVRPKQVVADASGLILVTDAGRQSVQVLDRDEGNPFVEVHETKNWRGWTLPMGIVAANADRLPGLSARLAQRSIAKPDVYVIVSDSLSGRSLILLGIVAGDHKGEVDGQ